MWDLVRVPSWAEPWSATCSGSAADRWSSASCQPCTRNCVSDTWDGHSGYLSCDVARVRMERIPTRLGSPTTDEPGRLEWMTPLKSARAEEEICFSSVRREQARIEAIDEEADDDEAAAERELVRRQDLEKMVASWRCNSVDRVVAPLPLAGQNPSSGSLLLSNELSDDHPATVRTMLQEDVDGQNGTKPRCDRGVKAQEPMSLMSPWREQERLAVLEWPVSPETVPVEHLAAHSALERQQEVLSDLQTNAQPETRLEVEFKERNGTEVHTEERGKAPVPDVSPLEVPQEAHAQVLSKREEGFQTAEEGLQLHEALKGKKAADHEASREPSVESESVIFRRQEESAKIWIETFLKRHGYAGVNARRIRPALTAGFINAKYPLHTAVKQNSANAVRLLLWAGADASLKNSSGQTPFEMANQINVQGRLDAVLLVFKEAPLSETMRKASVGGS